MKTFISLSLSLLALAACSPEPVDKPGDSHGTPLILNVTEGQITVNGKQARILNISQPDGKTEYTANEGEWFNVIVNNQLSEPTAIHWHGILAPYNEDGVPYVSQLPIKPGEKYPYQFKIRQSGTYWMHSHFCFQEQLLMAEPLILYPPKGKGPEKEVVILLEDFSFTNPKEIYKKLRSGSNMQSMQGMKGTSPCPIKGTPDLYDVDYDALLTNRRALADPELVEVTPGETVRLRIIAGSAATNYWIDLGKLKGKLIATDGSPVEPMEDSRFALATAQRIDVMVKIPPGEGAYPILGQGVGTTLQTGLILHTPNGVIPSLPQKMAKAAPGLTYQQELKFKAVHGLSKKPVDRSLEVRLGGSMQTYIWTINGQAFPQNAPLQIKNGERVELVFINETPMAHPMHLHGHFFQVTEIDGTPIWGAMRDTVLVKGCSTVKVQFDADNPGIWFLHCHILYHLIGGMAITINYDDLQNPYTYVPCQY